MPVSRFERLQPASEDKSFIRSVKNVLNIVGATGTTVPREIAPSGESDGTLRTALIGQDAAGNFDNLRTNANKELIVDVKLSGTPKILGTANPTATTNTALYNVPAATAAKIELLTACNRSAGSLKIRIGVDVGGNGTNTPSDAEWIYYDIDVPGGSTLELPGAALWLAADDDLVCYAETQNIAFVASGVEYA